MSGFRGYYKRTAGGPAGDPALGSGAGESGDGAKEYCDSPVFNNSTSVASFLPLDSSCHGINLDLTGFVFRLRKARNASCPGAERARLGKELVCSPRLSYRCTVIDGYGCLMAA